ncbi:ABC transporter ATP-binding protein [Acidicapsa dinghuensis]|uniref:ABC transporter ATP-binding protein n=1 Tax=Acidicapsa dinghuensis TaxID=2218256 RepID=A0ABW1EQD9_9BACT|nr:ATP-binding cassette domain-containing protein [Acidicapsa dinghuensis]
MSDSPEINPDSSSVPAADQPSLLEDLKELQSTASVEELEIAETSARAAIEAVVADTAANRPSGATPAPIAGPFIDFDRVSISFGDRKILDQVSFQVGRGQTLCILGRSGVGKSVSLRILLGFLKPDSGSVHVNGQEITSLGESGLQEVRKHVTMVFQNGALFDSLTVGENIAFPLREKGGLQEDQVQQLVTRLLNLVEASETINLLPSSLSTGQRRCIAIARALAAQPEAILYDEPTTMVDPIMGRNIGDLIQRLKLQLGITSIVVTHDMRFAIRLADLVLFLDSGQARFFGPIREFMECTDPHVQQFFTLDAYALPDVGEAVK